MSVDINTTIIFQKNWELINAKTEDGLRKYRYIINEGSSRSSKTISIIDVYDIYARTNANKRLTAWRDTRTDCVKTVLNDTIRHLSASKRWLNGHTFQETKSILKYSTGSTFEIHGTDDENTVMGLNQSVAWINEGYKISKSLFDQIDQRTEDFIILDWNPKLAHWIEDLKKDKRAIVIHSTFKDNPFCPVEQRNKILSYQPVSMCQLVIDKIMTERDANEYDISGNPLSISSELIIELIRCKENEYKNSASGYNWSVYGLGLKSEKPNRIHHFKEISLADYQALDVPAYYYSDWGSVDPWAIGEVKYYDGALYIRELNYESENTIRAKLTTTEWEQVGTEGEGIVNFMFSKLGIGYDKEIICDTNRPMKILALRESGWEYAVGINRKDSGASKGFKVDGIDMVNNIKVFYTSDSVNIKNEQENYSRKVDRYGVVLEEPEDFDDHHMNGIKYIATWLQANGVIKKI